MINKETYEEYFLLYTDGELNDAERAEVEEFAEKNPELKKELEILMQSVFVADENIVFENKEVLYKEEKKRAAVIFFGWRRIAVAAAVILFIGIGGWLYFNNNNSPKNNLAVIVPEKKDIAETKEAVPQTKDITAEKKDLPEVKDISKKHPAKTKIVLENKSAGKHLPEKNNIEEKQSVVVSDPIPDEPRSKDITPANIVNQVAMNDHSDEKINIPVNARNITHEINPMQNNIHYIDEDNSSDNNRIYFANTSISKRNSLRVVFRKASRIIDRITTLQ